MTRITIPLLHDHHSHGSLYAALGGSPNIAEMNAPEARELLRNLPWDRLTLVTGYRSEVHQFDSSSLADMPPAIIVNYSLHGYLSTDAALLLLREKYSEIAENRDDMAWKESNIPLLFARYTSMAGLNETKLDAFFAEIRQLGVGSTEDMSVSAEAYRIIRCTRFRDRFVFWMSPGEFDLLGTEEQDSVKGIKLYLDGSLGARTAAIRRCYRDGGMGFLTYLQEELVETAEKYGQIRKAGDGGIEISRSLDLSLHAIGERAIDQALDLASGLSRNGFDTALRLEHVQFITCKQARRAKELGVTLSMQPNFNSDSVDYADRLEKDMLAANNPFRMLIDKVGFVPGNDLLFGSDGMPHGLSYAFRWSLFPPYPGQRLTMDELIAGYGGALSGDLMVPEENNGFSVSDNIRVMVTVDESAKAVRVELALK
jgi:predicted amidohydrolase YtcJ